MILVTDEVRIEIRKWAIREAISSGDLETYLAVKRAKSFEDYVLGKKPGDEDKNIRRKGRKTV